MRVSCILYITKNVGAHSLEIEVVYGLIQPLILIPGLTILQSLRLSLLLDLSQDEVQLLIDLLGRLGRRPLDLWKDRPRWWRHGLHDGSGSCKHRLAPLSLRSSLDLPALGDLSRPLTLGSEHERPRLGLPLGRLKISLLPPLQATSPLIDSPLPPLPLAPVSLTLDLGQEELKFVFSLVLHDLLDTFSVAGSAFLTLSRLHILENFYKLSFKIYTENNFGHPRNMQPMLF